MINIYVLIALIAQFASGGFPTSTSTFLGPTYIEASFEELDYQYLGSPVLYKGLNIGSVSQITKTPNSSNVELELNSSHKHKLPESLVAIATTIKEKHGQSSIAALELIPTPKAKNNKKLNGYSSYTEYWKQSIL